MEYEVVMIPQTAEVDTYCEQCNHEITIGEDYYYNQEEEEVYCLRCAEKTMGKSEKKPIFK